MVQNKFPFNIPYLYVFAVRECQPRAAEYNELDFRLTRTFVAACGVCRVVRRLVLESITLRIRPRKILSIQHRTPGTFLFLLTLIQSAGDPIVRNAVEITRKNFSMFSFKPFRTGRVRNPSSAAIKTETSTRFWYELSRQTIWIPIIHPVNTRTTYRENNKIHKVNNGFQSRL